MPLKEFIDYFQQDLNDTASTLMVMEETIRIMKEEHNTEINISIGGTDHAENVWSKEKNVEVNMDPIFENPIFDSAREKVKRTMGQLEKPEEAFSNSLYTGFKCRSNNIFSVVKQVRSADEGTSVFNKCRKCYNKWRDGWYSLCRKCLINISLGGQIIALRLSSISIWCHQRCRSHQTFQIF